MTPSLTVAVADVEREETLTRTWDLSTRWLKSALTGTEAKPTGREGQATVQLFKNGRDVLVQGKVTAQIELPCARTLDPAIYDLDADLLLILRRKAPNAPSGRKEKPGRKGTRKDEEESTLTSDDVAEDTFCGDQIVLDDFVREQLLLELPMFPLRSDLRSADSAAISAPPQPPSSGAGIDPRLLPLRAIAEKLKGGK